MDHHKHSPSKLKDFATCPGFLPDQDGDTTKADEGTRCHLAAEKEDLSLVETEEQRFSVTKCLNYAKAFTKDAVFDEKEVRLSILNGMTHGTTDRVIGRRAKKGIHIDQLDWKFGENGVDDAETNLQGFAYVLGCFAKYPEAESITMHFVLPRRDEVTKHTFFRRDIPRLSLTIQNIIEKAQRYERTRDEKLLIPTERCTYCARRGNGDCPVATKLQVSYAKKYAPLEVVEEVHSSQITDLKQAAKYLVVVRVLEKMVDSAKKHLVELGMQNGGLPGPDGKLLFEVAEKSGTRKITNIPAAYEVLREYLSPEEIILKSGISLTGVMEMIAEKAPPRGKTKLRGEVETKLAEVDAISYGEPTRFLRKVKE